MKKRGFTLIELLVVIAIIGILAALLFPGLKSALQKSQDSKSSSNLQQIGVALNSYASDHDNYYPRASGDVPYYAEDSDPATWAWQQQIEQYIERGSAVFKSANVPGVEYAYYLGSRAAPPNPGEFAPVNRLRIRELSKHILGGECIYWTGSETDADKDDYSQTPSFNPDGTRGKRTPILFADGHVQSFDQFDSSRMTARYEGVGTGNTYPWSP